MQWVTIDACGNLASHDDQTLKQLARQHNVKVLPSLLTAHPPVAVRKGALFLMSRAARREKRCQSVALLVTKSSTASSS